VNHEFEKSRRECLEGVGGNLRYYSGLCHDSEENYQKLQGSHCPSPDSNRARLECKSAALQLKSNSSLSNNSISIFYFNS
jgi:hypothetical protein